MCQKCVRQRCLVIRLKQSMVEDEKSFALATKTNQTRYKYGHILGWGMGGEKW